jgi:serine/threonine-protein kinase
MRCFTRESDGLVYLAMEYVRAARSATSSTRPATGARQALFPVEQALGAVAAHAAGFVHRDVKLGAVSDSGAVKVTDFGLARALAVPPTATQGVLIGTAYLAPEQVSSGDSDERSDVYQAGLLYELLVGAPPHTGDSLRAVAQHVNTDVPGEHPPTRPTKARRAGGRCLHATASGLPRSGFLGRVQPSWERHRRSPTATTTVVLPDTPTTSMERPQDLLPPPPEVSAADLPPPSGPPVLADPAPRRPRWVTVLAVLVVAAVVAAAAAWIVGGGNPFDRTDVPQVEGATEAKARAS